MPDCKCLDPPDDASALSYIDGSPDFYLDGAIRSRVYWKPQEHFNKKGWSETVIAYAYIGHNEIVLNASRAGVIDYDVLAHEYGHNLGFRHSEGTVMNSWLGGMDDGKGGEPLSDVSREIFTKFGGSKVMDWDSDSAISSLGIVSSHFAKGHSTIRTLGYAGNRYASNNGVDAFYTGLWDGFSSQEHVKDKNINKGQFYG